jgi:hypothetical protein
MKEETFELVCNMIADGSSLRAAVANLKTHTSLFFVHLGKSTEAQERYTRAVNERTEGQIDEIIEIADDKSEDFIAGEHGISPNSTNVQRDRLRIDTRKWVASKMRPQKYGDALKVKHADHEGKELKINAIFATDLIKDVQTDESADKDSSAK